VDPALVTAVVLTRDEERNLPRALTSLPRGMAILVLDACSRDRTLAFARASGANVVQREWTDYVDARRYALAQVRTPWAFMLDADEALDDVLRDAVLAARGDVDGYWLLRTTYFCGKPLRLWRNERLLRLFRVGRARLIEHPAAAQAAPVHEAWSCDGPTGQLDGTLLHYSYPDLGTYRRKYDAYTSLEAATMRPSLLRAAGYTLAGFVRAAWLLLGKGALLDGPRGWYVAIRSAFYPAVAARKALFR
jgi:glycosyltransferase involved in cell wall biosynthesis